MPTQNFGFSVTVDVWTTEGGDLLPATVIPAGTNDSGMYWFFNPDNWELLLKVLDGCAINGHVWVLSAATTDVGYLIRVTDTVTGDVKEYRNALGTAAPALVDTSAFREACRL